MTTSAQVRTAWNTKIWTAAPILAFTDKIYLYDVLADNAFTTAGFYDGAVINLFLCLVQRQSEPQMCGTMLQTFQVRVQYYLQQTDMAENTYNTVEDRLNTLDDLVRTDLSGNWNSTVDYYQGGIPINIERFSLDGRTCWKGGYVYTAFKTI